MEQNSLLAQEIEHSSKQEIVTLIQAILRGPSAQLFVFKALKLMESAAKNSTGNGRVIN